MNAEVFALDPARVRRNFERAAARYDLSAVVARETGARMAERLDYVKIAPQRILDLGCGTLADFTLLQKRYRDAEYLGLDGSLAMLRASPALRRGWRRWLGSSGPQVAVADAAALPLPSRSVQLIWSNQMLHWLDDPRSALAEMHRVLSEEGLLMFATLGPDSLKELRAVAPSRVHRFIDMHDLGDALVGAGFADPVMDMDVLTLTYEHVTALMADLRACGGCAASARPRGLMGQGAFRALGAALEAYRQNGRIPLTLELVFGHAWKPRPRVTAEGHAIVRFEGRKRAE